ncbi:hypothetical protein GCM10010136_16970 [Limoniibacter endophyticus]|uniref:Uncharacterized protein n=1 Tax=Limoniibacter endophyticus TaxID=1565040 RepID=A0A8J3GH92_9HYPH|nr:hypothetical protein GCM10010136_16970 [Limoniibacter endophyticus]
MSAGINEISSVDIRLTFKFYTISLIGKDKMAIIRHREMNGIHSGDINFLS